MVKIAENGFEYLLTLLLMVHSIGNATDRARYVVRICFQILVAILLVSHNIQNQKRSKRFPVV